EFKATSDARTGIYSGRWFWTDRRYMGNTSSFADRELWDANYDDVADTLIGYVPYGGWGRPVIKQFRGTSAMGGIGGLDVDVLAVDKANQLAGPADGKLAPADQPARETPADWPWPTWREAAIQYQAIADALGKQLAQAREAATPAGG